MCPLETGGSESRTPLPNNTPGVHKQKHTVRFQFHLNTFDKTHNYLPSAHTWSRLSITVSVNVHINGPVKLVCFAREKQLSPHVLRARMACQTAPPAVLSDFLSSDEVLRFDGLRQCLSALNICKNITLSKSWLTFHRPPVESRFSHHCTLSPRSTVSSAHARQACETPDNGPTIKPKIIHTPDIIFDIFVLVGAAHYSSFM